MACAHEAHEHGEHEDDPERGHQYSLYQKINLDLVECLNEEEFGSGKTVFKPWDERLDRCRFVASDCDEELIFNIPFTGLVKLKAMIVIGGEGGSSPRSMKLFKNNPGMSFDDVERAEPTQAFDLAQDDNGDVEYGLRVVKFASVHHLTVYFPNNFGADSTKIYYIGFRGEFLEAFREQVVIANYEARAMPQDHKGTLQEKMNYQIK